MLILYVNNIYCISLLVFIIYFPALQLDAFLKGQSKFRKYRTTTIMRYIVKTFLAPIVAWYYVKFVVFNFIKVGKS